MAARALIDDLNEQQREIVFAPLGDSLVVAGAGTGKTRVLIARLAYLLEVEGFEPYQIMAMTFTNKAAGEMNERLATAMGWEDNKSMWVGTFHGLCFRLLRQYALEAMLPQNFSLLTPSDQETLLRNFYTSHGIKVKNDPKMGSLKDHGLDPKSVVNRIMRIKDRGQRPQISEAEAQHYVQHLEQEWPSLVQRSDDEIFEVIFACYERIRQNSGSVDFADLIVYAVHLLHSNEAVRTRLQQRFRYICVDEFQDTNEMQLQFLLLLKGPNNHIFVVGDDDQAIYGWRGAQVDNLNKLAQALPAMKVYELTINYRSSQDILNFANAVISDCTNRLTKKSLLNPYTFELWRQEDLFFLRLVDRSPLKPQLDALLNGRSLYDLDFVARDELITELMRAGILTPELSQWRLERRSYIFPGMAPLCSYGAVPKEARTQITYGGTTKSGRIDYLAQRNASFPELNLNDPEEVGVQYYRWQEQALTQDPASFNFLTESLVKIKPQPALEGKLVASRQALNTLKRQMCLLRERCAELGRKQCYEEIPHNQVHLLQVQDNTYATFGQDDGALVLELLGRLQESGYRYEDIAVLYRNNALSLQVERALAGNNIPYQVYGGIKFYERAEILSAMAYFRLLLNPKDDVSFNRAINEPKRGMGKVALGKLADFAQQCGLSIYEAIDHIVKTQDRQGLKLIKKCQDFYEQMEGFKRLLPKMRLGNFLAKVIAESGLRDYYAEVDLKDKAARKGTSRVDNLDQLVANAREYEELQVATQNGDLATINSVVAKQNARRRENQSDEDLRRITVANQATLDASSEGVTLTRAEPNDAQFRVNLFVNFVASSTLAASTERTAAGKEQDRGVQLMTIHASKGLEFPAVILVGVEEGTLPSRRSDDENEERRLLYVAVTRAQKCLFVTYNLSRMTYQGSEPTGPSSFLVEAVQHFENMGLDLGDAKAPYCFDTLKGLSAVKEVKAVALGARKPSAEGKVGEKRLEQWLNFKDQSSSDFDSGFSSGFGSGYGSSYRSGYGSSGRSGYGSRYGRGGSRWNRW